MVLVDIGNTNIHIWKNNKVYNTREIEAFNGDVYYISVNKSVEKRFLQKNPSAVDLEKYVKFRTSYKGLGIDRIMACKSINTGVVVDAGSAVTVDVMENARHLGGVILPGIYAFKKAFGTISEILMFKEHIIDYEFPNSTEEALNYGSVGAIRCIIEKFAENKKIFFTGSDGEFLSRMFENSEFVNDLVFKGMLITIKEMEKK